MSCVLQSPMTSNSEKRERETDIHSSANINPQGVSRRGRKTRLIKEKKMIIGFVLTIFMHRLARGTYAL
jgi:hypothetical protein